MNGFLLFTYAASIAVACMALALSIASKIIHEASWTGKYILFQSCLVGTLVVGMTTKLSLVFMPVHVFSVFEFIFNTVMMGCMGFVIVLLPYFMRWVIAKPWRRSQSLVFLPFALLYFGAGLATQILRLLGIGDHTFISKTVQTGIFLGVYVYCLVSMWVNLKNIDDKLVRIICLTINIVSLSMIPLSILSLFFPAVGEFSYPAYVLAFSIIIMVYDYLRFNLDKRQEENKPMLTLESLSQYKISEREFEVVKLICDGLTNKEIAQELTISVNTVNNHVANIFSKMEVRSRIDLLKTLKEGPWS